jgi:hypothetical protein
MNSAFEFALYASAIGIGGSAFIDLWSASLRRLFGVATLDYRLLGRWLGHLPAGQFFHERIGAAPRVRGEALLGWTAHYAIGVTFAAVLLILAGEGWRDSPTLLPALGVGIATVAAPWFVMQPAFGAGIAGSKAANPWPGRLRNLGTHTVYGLGLWASALGLAWL